MVIVLTLSVQHSTNEGYKYLIYLIEITLIRNLLSRLHA